MPLTRRFFLQILGIGGAAVAAANTTSAEPVVTLPEPPSDETPVEDLRPSRITQLERFLKSRGIKPANLARECGYTRQHLLRVRMGRLEPDARCMRAVVEAARRLSGEYVRGSDLFGAAAIRAGIPW